MADQTPLKNNNGEPAQFATGDTTGVAHGGTGATTAGAARTNLDVYSTGEVDAELAAKQDTLTDSDDVPGLTAELAAKQDQSDDLDELAALAPSKGDIAVHNGSAWAKLSAGANGTALVADDGEATGLKYASVAGSPESVVTADNGSGGAITKGQPVFMAADGDVELARANSGATSRVLGFVQDATVADGNPANIQIDGSISQSTGAWDALTGGSTGLTPGAVYAVSTATAGSLVEVSTVSGSGNLVCPCLHAVSTTEAVIKIGPRMWL